MIQTIILSNGLRYALLNAKLSAHNQKMRAILNVFGCESFTPEGVYPRKYSVYPDPKPAEVTADMIF